MKLYYESIRKDFKGVAEFENDIITVLPGTKIVEVVTYPKFSKEADFYRNNKEYVDNNKIVTKPINFKSVSTAAQFVSGTSVNGFKVWKTEKGISLKEIKKEVE